MYVYMCAYIHVFMRTLSLSHTHNLLVGSHGPIERKMKQNAKHPRNIVDFLEFWRSLIFFFWQVSETSKRLGWGMSHIWKSHVAHMNESCHTYEWVMSHIWMSRVTHMNESCHTYVSHAPAQASFSLSLIHMRDMTHMNVACACAHSNVTHHICDTPRNWHDTHVTHHICDTPTHDMLCCNAHPDTKTYVCRCVL